MEEFTAIDFLKNFFSLAMTARTPIPYPFEFQQETIDVLGSLKDTRLSKDLAHTTQCLISSAVLYGGTGFNLMCESHIDDNQGLTALVFYLIRSEDKPIVPAEEALFLMCDTERRGRIRELDKYLWLKAKRHLTPPPPTNGAHPSAPNWMENGINPFSIALYLDVNIPNPSWEPTKIVPKDHLCL